MTESPTAALPFLLRQLRAVGLLTSALLGSSGLYRDGSTFVADLSGERNAPGLVAGVADRLYRAASGNAIDIPRAPPGEAAPVE